MGNSSDHNDKLDITAAAPDRRRPGRSTYTNRFLIGLLRRESLSRPAEDPNDALTPVDAPVIAPGGSDNDLAPAIGILVSVGLGLLLWAIIVLIVWPFIHAGGHLDARHTRSSVMFPAGAETDEALVLHVVAHMMPRPYVPGGSLGRGHGAQVCQTGTSAGDCGWSPSILTGEPDVLPGASPFSIS